MNKAKRIVDNMDSENAFAVCSEIGIIDENGKTKVIWDN